MFNIKIPKWLTRERLIYLVVLIAMSLLCERMLIKAQNEAQKRIDVTSKYNKTSQDFEVSKRALNGKNKTIAKQNQVILSKEEALKSQLITNKELKSENIKLLNAKISLTEEIKVLKKEAKFNALEVKKIGSDDYIKVPQSFSFKDSILSFNGTITKESVFLDSIKLVNDIDLYIGETGGMFKRKTPVVEYVANNDVIITKMNNVIIPKKKWYERRWIKYTTVIVGGIAIYKTVVF